MSQFFECVHCGTIAPVETSPPRCANCGHGTGVLHLTDPRRDTQNTAGRDKTGTGDGSGKKDPSSVLPG